MESNKSPQRPIVRVSTPFDTGKVKVGLCYFPVQSWSPGRDMYTLQTALLGSRSVVRLTWWERLRSRLVSFAALFWSHHERY